MSGEDLEALGLVESVAGSTGELPEFAVMSVESLAGLVTATDIGTRGSTCRWDVCVSGDVDVGVGQPA